jgi:hypothetical protein
MIITLTQPRVYRAIQLSPKTLSLLEQIRRRARQNPPDGDDYDR